MPIMPAFVDRANPCTSPCAPCPSCPSLSVVLPLQVLNGVGYICFSYILLWVVIELIIQYGVRDSAGAAANQFPLGVTFPGFVTVRRPFHPCTMGGWSHGGPMRAITNRPLLYRIHVVPLVVRAKRMRWRAGRMPDLVQPRRAHRWRHPDRHADRPLRDHGHRRRAPVPTQGGRDPPHCRRRGQTMHETRVRMCAGLTGAGPPIA